VATIVVWIYFLLVQHSFALRNMDTIALFPLNYGKLTNNKKPNNINLEKEESKSSNFHRNKLKYDILIGEKS
jgi:hypothetical protein